LHSKKPFISTFLLFDPFMFNRFSFFSTTILFWESRLLTTLWWAHAHTMVTCLLGLFLC
jgi:hypothetical protein